MLNFKTLVLFILYGTNPASGVNARIVFALVSKCLLADFDK